jgi:hypothetical protein
LPEVVDGYAPEQMLNCIDADVHIRKLMPEVAASSRRPVRSAYEWIPILLLRDAKLQPDCLNQSANTRSPGMVRNLNASRG